MEWADEVLTKYETLDETYPYTKTDVALMNKLMLEIRANGRLLSEILYEGIERAKHDY